MQSRYPVRILSLPQAAALRTQRTMVPMRKWQDRRPFAHDITGHKGAKRLTGLDQPLRHKARIHPHHRVARDFQVCRKLTAGRHPGTRRQPTIKDQIPNLPRDRFLEPGGPDIIQPYRQLHCAAPPLRGECPCNACVAHCFTAVSPNIGDEASRCQSVETIIT